MDMVASPYVAPWTLSGTFLIKLGTIFSLFINSMEQF
jgi:hypothetical protein